MLLNFFQKLLSFGQIELSNLYQNYRSTGKKIGIKNTEKNKIGVKSHGQTSHFVQKLTPLGGCHRIEANSFFVLKSRGKITKLKI
jgi:hypothetical protein